MISPFCGTDFDGDGKQECVVGNNFGELKYLVNTGTSSSPKFTERTGTQNPFDGIDVGSYASPSCGTDFDGDGIKDCVVGIIDGKLMYLLNYATVSYCFYRGSFSFSEWRCLCSPGYYGLQCFEACPGEDTNAWLKPFAPTSLDIRELLAKHLPEGEISSALTKECEASQIPTMGNPNLTSDQDEDDKDLSKREEDDLVLSV